MSLLPNFLRDLDERGIRYVVAGNPEGLPAVVGDVDLVVSTDDYHRLVRDTNIWFGNGRRLLQAMRHEVRATTFVITSKAFDPDIPTELLPVDICADYVRRARHLVGSAELLNGRRRYKVPGGDLEVWVPAPPSALKYYLAKKAGKGMVDGRALTYLGTLLEETSAVPAMVELFGPDLAALTVDAIRVSEPETLERLLPRLQSALIATRPRQASMLIAEAGRRLRRLLRPTGLLVELTGQSAAELEVLAVRLTNTLARAFRRASVTTAKTPLPSAPLGTYSRLVRSELIVRANRVPERRGKLTSATMGGLKVYLDLQMLPPGEEAGAWAIRQILDHLASRQIRRLGSTHLGMAGAT